MFAQQIVPNRHSSETSPLTLSDHLITLAEQADRAGFTSTAQHLVTLACSVFDEAVSPRH
jgi:hypothetical protein